MPDNAELRIVIQDSGGPVGPGAPIPAAAPPALRPAAAAGTPVPSLRSAEPAAAGTPMPSLRPPAEQKLPDLGTAPGGPSLPSFRADFGPALQSLAGNQNMAALTEGASLAGKALSAVGLAGGPVGVAFAGAAAALTSFQGVMDSFIDRGKQLAQFSPELASAGAEAEVRSLKQDIDEANRLGPALAQLTEAQSKAEAGLREILLPIKQWLVERLAGVMEVIADAVGAVKGNLAAVVELFKIVIDFFNNVFGSGQLSDIPALLDSIGARLKQAYKEATRELEAEKEDKLDPLLGLNELMQERPLFGLRRIRINQVAPGGVPLNIPAFGGL